MNEIDSTHEESVSAKLVSFEDLARLWLNKLVFC